ncbi:MAG TPA: hypothetical protein VFV87_22560, partial [Pirellulaceae bacterium]|nr:hypothetical protein [Pirellulaceae bacterium]
MSGYKYMVPSDRLASNKVEEARFRALVQSILLSRTPLEENRANFDAYYTWFAFPMMTQVSTEALQLLPERRNKFLRTELEVCSDARVHAHLVSLTLDQMSRVVQDNFHPAVRYNAMLLISCLNDQEVVRNGSERRLPEPMSRALPFILDQFRKPENSDAIKVAALIGLSRHLEWDPHRLDPATAIPAGLRTEIVNELLALAQMKDPPEGRDSEGQLWFRRRAIEALGFACFAKSDPGVAAAMDKLLTDESEPVSLRLTVAAAMGRMNYQAPVKLDTLATVKQLGYLALLACDDELNRVTKLKETETERVARIRGEARTSSSGGGDGMDLYASGSDAASMETPDSPGGMYSPMGMGAGGYGAGGTGSVTLQDPKAYRFDFVRRKIRAYLYCVQLGLTGGDDFDPQRTAVIPATAANDAKPPSRGMYAFAKPGEEKKYASEVYG